MTLGRARLQALIDQLGEGLLERDAAVRLTLLAALAGEHVLLIGPPGTAKSALARRLQQAFPGAPYFERLLTRFSTPEELFGPLSLKALEDDRYERLTEGFLPTAGIAFLDEVFKANSAILNALLTLLNEREFDNGTQRVKTPLVAVVAASNEVPTDEALLAFYDRFLVRMPVSPVGDAAFATLLALGTPHAEALSAPTVSAPPSAAHSAVSALPASKGVSAEDQASITRAAQQVRLSEDFIDGCRRLRAWLTTHQMPMSDRRWRQFVQLAQTAAATEERAALDLLDLGLAPWVAGTRPEDLAALQTWFIDEALQAPPTAAPWLERAVQAFEKQLGLEQQTPTEGGGGQDDGAGKLALARAIGLGRMGEGEVAGRADDLEDAGIAAAPRGGMQRIVSARLEDRQRKHWGRGHIEARVAQVAQVQTDVQGWMQAVQAARDARARALAQRLWQPPELRARALERHDEALALLAGFSQRLDEVREGFAALPLNGEDDSAVRPVVWGEGG